MSVTGDSDATRFPNTASDSPDRIGPYHLLQKVGEGGMGEVWVAEQREPIRRTVALKIIKVGMDTRQVVARFEAERQALAVMDHPAIAKVLDAGETDHGRPYFVMEYVKGEPITTYCDREQLSTDDRLALFIHVCEGVQHAHQKGIIHRDLKPSNVLVTIQDGQPVPKIIDFGIAKATAHHLTEQTIFTELGILVGTPEYMSPEQAEMGGLDVDTRTDIYSLGVLLYELLTGSLPFESKWLREKALDEVRRAIREVDPPRPSTRVTQMGAASTEAARKRLTEPARLASQLRGDLDWITMRALEKNRARRYDTAIGMANDVRRHLAHEPVTASPPSAVYRTKKFVRRHRFGVTAAGMLVLLLLAFGVTMAVQAGRIARERDRADREAEAARQVSAFLVGLFKVSNPSEARGNALTARELLDRAAQDLDQRLRAQPELQARLQAIIGEVFNGLGLYARAQTLLDQAVTTERRVLGENHPDTLAAVNHLANSFWYRGQYREAEPLYADLVKRRRLTLGPEHPDTLRACYDLASVYILQDRRKEGEPLLQKTLEVQRRVLGASHPDTIDSLNNLQGMYFRQRRYSDSLPIAIEVLAVDRRILGDDHPSTLRAKHNLATVYDRLERYDQAEPLFLEVLAGKRRVLGEAHPQTLNTANWLADMYAGQRRFEECERVRLTSYDALDRALGPQDERTVQQVSALMSLYEQWAKPDKAAEWRRKLPAK